MCPPYDPGTFAKLFSEPRGQKLWTALNRPEYIAGLETATALHHRYARCSTGGLPGDRSLGLSDRSDFNFFLVINTSGQDVLQRLVESTQYVSIRYGERLAEAGIEPSVGSKGDSYDNALAETINGLYKAEVIHRRSWPTRESVELATLEWVSWFNHYRLPGPIGYIPPAEAEANYYRQLASQAARVVA